MSKETENQEKHPEPTNQVEVQRAERTDLDKVMGGADVSYDLVDKITDLRLKVRDIRTKGSYNRIIRRDLLKDATCELLKVEKEYISSEVAKGQELIKKERTAWMINLHKAWVKFLKKVGAEAAIEKQNFAQEWMRYSTSKRREIESLTDITQKQKDRLLDIVDNDEDKMITEIEKMADTIIEGSSK